MPKPSEKSDAKTDIKKAKVKDKVDEKPKAKEKAKRILDSTIEDLAAAQDLLYADDRHALLIVLQAMDAAGKDGMIKHVMSGINPQGCQVHSFKKPSDEEIDHDF